MKAMSLALLTVLLAPPAAVPAGDSSPAAAPAASDTAAAEIGKAAPDFTLTDTEGKTVHLSDLRGKTVVLEWFNPDCPFVKFAHGETGPLRKIGNEWAAKGVAWFAVNSSAPGLQGNGKERNVEARKDYGIGYPVLLDEAGTVGKAYGAKSTPHVFVIDAKGVLVYRGGVDNAPFGQLGDGEAKTEYLRDALDAVAAGKTVAVADTKSYGCSVKYAKK